MTDQKELVNELLAKFQPAKNDHKICYIRDQSEDDRQTYVQKIISEIQADPTLKRPLNIEVSGAKAIDVLYSPLDPFEQQDDVPVRYNLMDDSEDSPMPKPTEFADEIAKLN